MIRKIYLAYWVRTFCAYFLKPCTEKGISEMSSGPYMGGMGKKWNTELVGVEQ